MTASADIRVVAIDGPSASGKSTVARRVASELGAVYVDSGSLYRCVTWQCLKQGMTRWAEEDVLAVIHSMRTEFRLEGGAVRFVINGIDPGAELRSGPVVDRVSVVAAMPSVREWVVAQLRDMTRFGPLVMEGRDIGSVVFPDAPHKFFLDASPEERARRRCAEESGSCPPEKLDRVAASIRERDHRDLNRAVAPLRVASGAMSLDTTGMSIEDVVRRILHEVGSIRPPQRGKKQ